MQMIFNPSASSSLSDPAAKVEKAMEYA